MSQPKSPARRVNAVDNAFDIIEFLHETGGATLTEVSDKKDLAKSTAHGYLKTMQSRGYLVESDGVYRLSLKFLDYGCGAKSRETMDNMIQEVLEQVVEQTNEIAWFVVEEQGQGVFVSKATGERAVQPYGRLGKRTTLHDIAAGKAILAYLPDKRVDEILNQHGLIKRTGNTITTRKELFEELEKIRSRGFALNRGENVEGWRAVASPVVHDGQVFGAIATSAPKNRMQDERFSKEVPQIVSGAANEIQLKLLSS